MPSLPSLDSNCPSLAELKALLGGSLDQTAAGRWQQHVAGCESCRQALDSLRVSSLQITQSLTSSAHRGEASTIDLSTAAHAGAESLEIRGIVLADRYELGGEIARGGMGVVHRATDVLFQREVAVKLLLPRWQKERDPELKRLKRSQALEAFRYESEITARLQHPGIPPVHDLGTLSDGLPFLAMKLIQGETLETLLAARTALQQDLSRWLQIFEQIAQAVGYAHSHGILHRDLKPANVMVGQFGEVQVMDWGLAKVIGAPEQVRLAGEDDAADDDAPALPSQREFASLPGDIKGTLAYMPTEQARGQINQLEARADVFGLGAVLCEIVTGQPPYLGANRDELYAQAVAGELSGAFGRIRACGVDAEIIDLAVRCLSADAVARPANGTEVAQAIAAHRASVELRLRRAETERALSEQRLVEQSRRRKLWYGIAAALLLLTVVTSSLAVVYATSNAIIADREEKANAAAKLAAKRETEAIAASQLATRRQQESLAASARALAQEKIATDKAAISDAVNHFLQFDLLALAGAQEQLDVGLEADPDLKVRDLVLRAAERIEGKFAEQPLVEAETRTALSLSLYRLGEYAAAARQNERIRELYTKLLGPADPKTKEVTHALADAYLHAGKHEESVALHSELLESLTKQHGPEHAETLLQMNSLANALRTSGEFNRAVQMYEETLRLQTKTRGADHLDTLLTKHNLAMAYRYAGQLDRAAPMLEEVVKLLSQVHGPDHPDTLGVISNLALLYRATGQLKRALPLYDQVLEGRRKSLGDDHPDTIGALSNLAVAYDISGQSARALPMLEEVLQRVQAKSGPEDLKTLEATNNLAICLQHLGELKRALALAESTLKLRIEKLGPEHPQSLGSLQHVGLIYSDLGNFERALPLLEKSLQLRRAKFGEEHTDTLKSKQSLSVAYLKVEEYAKALPLLEDLLRIDTAKGGSPSPNALVTMNNLAAAYHNVGQFEQAIEVRADLLKIADDMYGPQHIRTLGSKLGLAMSEIQLKRHAVAEVHLQQVWSGSQQLPAQIKTGILVATAQEFIKLYEAWDKFEELAKWRAELKKLEQ